MRELMTLAALEYGIACGILIEAMDRKLRNRKSILSALWRVGLPVGIPALTWLSF